MKQETLFELPPAQVEPAEFDPELGALAVRLPSHLYLGGMSWAYRGWAGHVYGLQVSEKSMASHGLTAYSRHPLLRMVEIDRSYYEPLPGELLRSFAEQVPGDFRFYVKAHEDCVVQRFPEHARYGMKRGATNPRFLDASYASDAVIAPLVESLGEKLTGLLFQFPPQDTSDPLRFAQRLSAFLQRLPRGVPYAVELRNPELLTSAYATALCESGAVHCHNLWTAMPGLHAQARAIPPAARNPLLIRWLLRSGHRYEDANASYAPFHRIVEADLATRSAVTQLAARALQHDVPVHILVDNKAEGCTPASIRELARELAATLHPD